MPEQEQGADGLDYDAHVIARVREFVWPGVPWNRSLWSAGSVLALHELLEYGQQLQAQETRPAQVQHALAAARESLSRDPGAGDSVVSARLLAEFDVADQALAANLEDKNRNKAPVDGFADANFRDRFRHLVRRVEDGYLARWADALRLPSEQRPSAERAARLVAAHLLDSGLSPEQVGLLGRDYSSKSAGEFCEAAERMLTRPPRAFTVIVPLLATPSSFLSSDGETEPGQTELIDDQQALQAEYRHELDGAYTSGLKFLVTARDSWSALAHARELLARLQARLSVSANADVLRPHPEVSVQGHPRPLPLESARRPVRVPAIDQSDRFFSLSSYTEADAIDDALELLAGLSSNTQGAALTNGWAALEGLLGGGGPGAGLLAQ